MGYQMERRKKARAVVKKLVGHNLDRHAENLKICSQYDKCHACFKHTYRSNQIHQLFLRDASAQKAPYARATVPPIYHHLKGVKT